MNRDRIHPCYEKFIIEYSEAFTDKEYNQLMKSGDYSDAESNVDTYMHEDDCYYSLFEAYNRKTAITFVLIKCQKLRLKLSVLNRRLLKVKAENRRLRKLLDGLKSIEIED